MSARPLRFAMPGFMVCLAAFGTVGCGAKIHSAKRDQLLPRASFDLMCPQEQLRIVDLGDNKGVSGCGRRTVYVEHCDGDPRAFTTSCDWARNGEVLSEAPPASQSPVFIAGRESDARIDRAHPLSVLAAIRSRRAAVLAKPASFGAPMEVEERMTVCRRAGEALRVLSGLCPA